MNGGKASPNLHALKRCALLATSWFRQRANNTATTSEARRANSYEIDSPVSAGNDVFGSSSNSHLMNIVSVWISGEDDVPRMSSMQNLLLEALFWLPFWVSSVLVARARGSSGKMHSSLGPGRSSSCCCCSSSCGDCCCSDKFSTAKVSAASATFTKKFCSIKMGQSSGCRLRRWIVRIRFGRTWTLRTRQLLSRSIQSCVPKAGILGSCLCFKVGWWRG